MDLSREAIAEFLGTLWLVLGGVGSAVLAANFMPDTNLGIGLVGVSLAFGLTVVTGAYALGHISGGHFNPAVTLGILTARRIGPRHAIVYIVAQVIGAIVAAAIIVVIANGVDGFSVDESGLGANGFADHSPGLYNWGSAFLTEVVLTFFFLLVILGVTGRDALTSFAPLAIGLALTLIHLISIPVTNTSVNPARSTGPAVFVGDWALTQLWMFWVAPLLGAVLAGLVHYFVIEERAETEVGYGEAVATEPASG
ncbi:MAG TPA: aquaporin Z [Acidimicrobiales bacterium]|jgi:aquaporin Z|nr:aquaporin Z [Acidimicrobiales bacterium]